MFEALRELPLFRGVSTERIAEIVGKARFHFLKYLPDGSDIVTEGEPCTHIKFILSGKVRSTIANHDGRFSVSQTLEAPDVIAPDFLFGRATDYPCTARALEPTSIIQIEKSDYLRILNMDSVFMLNYLNYLSMNAQKAVAGVLGLTMGSVQERVAFWIIALTQPSGKDIVLQCRQRDLYAVFGVQRSTFIAALDNLKDRGLIEYTNSTITILDRRALIDLLLNHSE